MMRHRQVLVWAVILTCGILIPGNLASGALNVLEPAAGQKITVDTNTGYAWYWDMAGFINETYDQQITAIAGLNAGSGFAGLTGWHMASQSELNGLFGGGYFSGDIVAGFGPTYNLADDPFVQGRVDTVHSSGTGHWVSSLSTTSSGWYPEEDSAALINLSAWVVTEDYPAVPAPGAILLGTLGTGLVGWLRRRRAL